MEKTNIGCAVSEHADRHTVIFLVLISKRQCGSNGHMRSDNCMTSPKVLFHIGHMHRPPFPLGNPGSLSEQLCHHIFNGQAGVYGYAMIAVSRDYPVLRLAHRQQPGAHRLLADIKVQESANFALLVKLGSAFLYPA